MNRGAVLMCLNIPRGVKEEHIYELFCVAGPIDEICFGKSGKSVFIVYEHKEAVTTSKELFKDVKLYGRTIRMFDENDIDSIYSQQEEEVNLKRRYEEENGPPPKRRYGEYHRPYNSHQQFNYPEEPHQRENIPAETNYLRPDSHIHPQFYPYPQPEYRNAQISQFNDYPRNLDPSVNGSTVEASSLANPLQSALNSSHQYRSDLLPNSQDMSRENPSHRNYKRDRDRYNDPYSNESEKQNSHNSRNDYDRGNHEDRNRRHEKPYDRRDRRDYRDRRDRHHSRDNYRNQSYSYKSRRY